MPAPFKKVTVDQFAAILDRFQFTRSINAVHMHHTWRPNHQQFKGHDTIVSMWRHHTEHNGWSDIAQHITIDPDGLIWLGRNWNMAPASASGHNGSSRAGPFMFEMIGDFDKGRDPFAGAQKATTLAVIALVQECFGLPVDSLKFHNAMSAKTCPGSAIDYQQTLREVTRQRAANGSARRAGAGMAPPFPPDAYATNEVIEQALSDLARRGAEVRAADSAGETDTDADACSHHHGDAEPAYEALTARAAAPTPQQLQTLRAHLVNLTMGEFSSSGQWRSSRADVDAIFSEHLPRSLAAARSAGRPLRLMFQAHGGLNDEATGLAIAQRSVAWWQSNDIYPIYFAWETGLFETIVQLMRAAPAARSFADYTSDPLVQEAVRALQAPRIWGGMKQSAQIASSPGVGGAYYVARQLAAFCKQHKDVELHAVGHSAGSIFHAWFVPCALALGAPEFRSLHLMAPAIRVDQFKETLAPLVGAHRGIAELTVYTMKEDLEADDNCGGIYRKSLLYLIFHALEAQRKTPILGLEESLRADPDLGSLFGLDGGPGNASVIWSQTQARQGRSASAATTHGGFDEDPATMGSIARRILGKADHEAIAEYQAGAGRAAMAEPASTPTSAVAPGLAMNVAQITLQPAHQQLGDGVLRVPQAGSARRALCVGINDYAELPLTGCVADAHSWSRSLSAAGFAVTRLLNQRATRAGIIDALEQMIGASRSGDVLVFQYSGHGTQVPDDNGDESGGDTPGLDEALCPFDYHAGALLIDDDIGRIFARVPDGVNLTCFMDCCHSGTLSRFAMAGKSAGHPVAADARPRFLPASPEMVEAHRRFRARGLAGPAAPDLAGAAAGGGSERGSASMREVVFSACRSDESAWESGGQGEFTVRATRILDASLGALTNAQFADQVSAAFGELPRQHAQVDSSRTALSRPLLAPLAERPLQSGPVIAQPSAPVEMPMPVLSDLAQLPDLTQLVELLHSVEQLLQGQLHHPLPNGKFKTKGKSTLQHAPAQSMQSGRQNR